MVGLVQVKSILNQHKKRDAWFLDDYSATPYRGCQFQCAYCYIEGSKYGTYASGGLAVKANAPVIFTRQLKLRAEKKEYGFIFLGSSSDPYMPLEEEYRYTRRMLEIILRYRFPVEVCTKSALVTRDLDLLRQIDETAILPPDLAGQLDHKAIIAFSLSTVDEELARLFEPGAPSPADRLRAARQCKDAGLLVGVNLMPLLPFLSDDPDSIDQAVCQAKEHGVDYVLAGGLTLFGSGPGDCRTKFYSLLVKHYPDLLPRYENLFEGGSYPPPEYQARLEAEVRKACERHGVRYGILGSRAPQLK